MLSGSEKQREGETREGHDREMERKKMVKKRFSDGPLPLCVLG